MIKRMPSSNAKVLGEYQHTVDKRRIYAENNVISFGGIGGVREVFVEYLKKNWIGWSRTEADYLSLIFTATTLPYGGTSLYRKIEGWNVEIIGANMTSDQWGVPAFYNFQARMECLIFGNTSSLYIRDIP